MLNIAISPQGLTGFLPLGPRRATLGLQLMDGDQVGTGKAASHGSGQGTGMKG